VTQIWKSEKITQKLELHFVPDTNVLQRKTRQQQDTGLVECGNMPFEKRGKYYYSPSGRKYTEKQVKLYYATNGFRRTK